MPVIRLSTSLLNTSIPAEHTMKKAHAAINAARYPASPGCTVIDDEENGGSSDASNAEIATGRRQEKPKSHLDPRVRGGATRARHRNKTRRFEYLAVRFDEGTDDDGMERSDPCFVL